MSKDIGSKTLIHLEPFYFDLQKFNILFLKKIVYIRGLDT